MIAAAVACVVLWVAVHAILRRWPSLWTMTVCILVSVGFGIAAFPVLTTAVLSEVFGQDTRATMVPLFRWGPLVAAVGIFASVRAYRKLRISG